jgi:hypothetical protein
MYMASQVSDSTKRMYRIKGSENPGKGKFQRQSGYKERERVEIITMKARAMRDYSGRRCKAK